MNIDREIAEKVMGWTVRDSKKLYWYERAILISNWHPSADIKQALEVVEKMRERGWLLDKLTNLTAGKKWLACFWTAKEWNQICRQSDTPAMAICRAALEAVKHA